MRRAAALAATRRGSKTCAVRVHGKQQTHGQAGVSVDMEQATSAAVLLVPWGEIAYCW
jgi:hypothetical protein